MPRRLVALAALSVLLSLPASAVAAGDHGRGLDTAVGNHDGRLPNGLYKLTLADGKVLYTHGGDPKAGHGTDMNLADPQLPPVCDTTNVQEVLYAYTRKSGNRLTSVKADLQGQLARNTHVLNESAIAAGGIGARFRVHCEGGAVSVKAFAVKGTGYSQVVNAAKAAGYNRTDRDYTVFVDAIDSSACGVGSYITDETGSAANRNNNGGGYAITYRDCWFGRTSMHENGHNQGAVQPGAPQSTGSGGHCNDLLDVMCYAPDGGNRNQSEITVCTLVMYFDCRDDTYFDPAPETGEWLASKWNIGASYNRFIAFP